MSSFPRKLFRRHSRESFFIVIPAKAFSSSFPRKLFRRHSREGGNPGNLNLDSRLRGNDDEIAGMTMKSMKSNK
ncbi:MAG: hypothetical protein KKH06_01640, partial [Gammaproteobacteria bacterium]|nr:hypothetical protein [Gammaproteobacteria bacterium]